MSRQFGRPDLRPAVRPAGPPEPTRPAVSAKFSAEILRGGVGQIFGRNPSRRTAAESAGREPPPSPTAVSFR